MQFGMNLLLWSGTITEEHLPTIEKLQEMGYQGVEIPMFDDDVEKYAALGKQLDQLGMRRTAVTIRNVEDNPISTDPANRANGVACSKRALDCCAAVGAELLAGPFHSALGAFSGAGATEDEWKWGVETMKEVAEHAGKVDVKLSVEPLNRFECYFLNGQADAARFTREVDHPHCGILYDTFHANIEEKNIAQAIETCADTINHVHISENDRSTPGQGGVRWDETFDALHKMKYDGWLMVEAFGLALPEIAAATKIWRRMYESEEQLARDALNFMKDKVQQRWGS